VSYELSIVVPTRNEVENVRPLLAGIAAVLADRSWEILFVDDDSPDGTADLVDTIAAANAHVRCLKRVGRRGLSSACLEGFQATSAPFIAVMDGDLQHDERLLPAMLATLEAGGGDLVIGSRYVPGGGAGGLAATRHGLSRVGTWVASPPPGGTSLAGWRAAARWMLALIEAHGWRDMAATRLPAQSRYAPQKIPAAVQAKPRESRDRYTRIFALYGDCGTGGMLDAV